MPCPDPPSLASSDANGRVIVDAIDTDDDAAGIPGHVVGVEVAAGIGQAAHCTRACTRMRGPCVDGAQDLLFVACRKSLLLHDVNFAIVGPGAPGPQGPNGRPGAQGAWQFGTDLKTTIGPAGFAAGDEPCGGVVLSAKVRGAGQALAPSGDVESAVGDPGVVQAIAAVVLQLVVPPAASVEFGVVVPFGRIRQASHIKFIVPNQRPAG